MVVAKMNMNTIFVPQISSSIFPRKWTRKCTNTVFCVIHRNLGKLLRGKEASPCYCRSKNESEIVNGRYYSEAIGIISQANLPIRRKKKLKQMIDLIDFLQKLLNKNKGFEAGYGDYNKNQKKVVGVHGSSACGYDSCVSPMKKKKMDDPKLHHGQKQDFFKDFSEAHYLDACFICGKSLYDSDIFMFRGNIPFCSIECREKQMNIDEAEEKKLKFALSVRKSNFKSSTSMIPMTIITVS